jgi:hypothetical protein
MKLLRLILLGATLLAVTGLGVGQAAFSDHCAGGA